MAKIYNRVRELLPKVEKLFKDGIQRGQYMGYTALEDYYSVKLGATTYVMASPFSGKTEFWLDILINLSEYYGWKHAICTPETGSTDEIIAELASKYMRKPFYKNYKNAMTQEELYRATTFLDEHFFIVDADDKEMVVQDFYKIVDDIEAEYGVRIHTTLIDPFNEFEYTDGNNYRDIALEKTLGFVRKNAKAKNRHNAILTHCRDQQPVTKGGMSYYPPPTARDYSGGQAWFRKGMGMIGLWRPPTYVEIDGRLAHDNELHVIIQKFKPKGTGKKGTVRLFYDVECNRYYSENEFGGRNYAAPKQKTDENNFN